MNLAAYVHSRCRVDADSGCMVWVGATNNSGSPVFRLCCCGTRDPRRVLWEAAGHDFDASMVFVEPQCADGHRCIAPAHQQRLTRRQAARRPGMMSSGRAHSAALLKSARAHPHVRLNLELVRQMRARYAEIGNAAQIAREFSIDHAHAHRIVTNQSWREPSPWAI